MARRALTAFVREVVLPAGPEKRPKLMQSAMRFRLRAGPSAIDRWGIFAAEEIPARRRVVEYTGERITAEEVVRRSARPQVYHFWTSQRTALDGAVGGSGAEFINHSCEPNLVARLRGGRIWMVSLRRIAKGEELLFDYQLSGLNPIACRCGAAGCRGWLNSMLWWGDCGGIP